jgi:tetratricopeptide (TPR) repeat protein
MSGLVALLLSVQLAVQLAMPPVDMPQLAVPQLFDQALKASRSGDFDQALPLWNQVLDSAPNDAAAWSNRGIVQLALGDPQAAIADQSHAMELAPDNPDPHLNRGTAEEALGQWAAAEADYRWILERFPAPAESTAAGEPRASALYNLGNVQGSLGDWPAARASFEAAADARPGFAMARSSTALVAFQLDDLADAERELRNLIRRYPLFADARAALTALLWQKGASGEAESHWAAASGLDPRYRQGEWLLETRRWPPKPVAALEQFLALES